MIQRRVDQTALLLDLLADLPHLRPAKIPTGQRWNAYAPLLHLQLDRPREFSEHLAERGVPNSTGSFRLIPLDQRPMFTDNTRPPCITAAELLDGILAVALSRHDDEEQIRNHAETITREVTRWASA